MKKKKLLKTAAKEVSGDTKAIKASLSHGVVQTMDATTDFAASTSAGLVGFLVGTAGEILTWAIAHPLKTIILAFAVWGGTIVYDNLETEGDRTTVNWTQVREDASARYQQIRQKLDEYGVPEFKMPEFISRHLPASENENSPVLKLTPVSDSPRRSDYPKVKQSSDQIGAFLKQKGLTQQVYTVDRNAYQTARNNHLSFQPGADVSYTLRGCANLQKGSKIVFEKDADGLIISCRRVR